MIFCKRRYNIPGNLEALSEKLCYILYIYELFNNLKIEWNNPHSTNYKTIFYSNTLITSLTASAETSSADFSLSVNSSSKIFSIPFAPSMVGTPR